jgi:L-asparaginase II
MGRRYAIVGEQNATASDTIIGITSAATIRPSVYEIIVGSAATPADQAFNLMLKRYTAVGTATAVTPQALDPNDPAALAAGISNSTVEPTYTAGANMLSISINQQATFRWVVPPEEGIKAPATANNGLGLQFVVVSGGTALTEATFLHEE